MSYLEILVCPVALLGQKGLSTSSVPQLVLAWFGFGLCLFPIVEMLQ
jgi:hypothetical protein